MIAEKQQLFSIGILIGRSPFELGPPEKCSNPVLTREDVIDVKALFVADPFMVKRKNSYYMFFEVYNESTEKGEIGLAKSDNAFEWKYQRLVLSEPFHLSYPYVFQWENEIYMMPESAGESSIRLYRAKSFPVEWEFVKIMISGQRFADSSIVYHAEKWWLFTESSPGIQHDTLRLFFAEDLLGAWTEHPCSPIVKGNPHFARPAGRIIPFNNRLLRFAQDCSPSYGAQVYAFVLTELGEKNYAEREISSKPILFPANSGWNANGMHHIDPHLFNNEEWIACVDGWVGVESLKAKEYPVLERKFSFAKMKNILKEWEPYVVAQKIKWHLMNKKGEINKLKVISLLPQGKFKGYALLSYIIEGFFLKPGQAIPTTHTNIWASLEIAKILQNLGFAVDVISYQNRKFIPKRSYSIMVDVRDNLERLSPFLDRKCIKVMHLDTKNLLFHNLALFKRLLALQKRKGVTIQPVKFQMPNQSFEHAHCGISTGDKFTIETFQYAGKSIYSVPIPASEGIPWREDKNYEQSRKNFLWFGSGGFVLKGLDLVLDAFAELPEYHLTVCGPIQDERDFVKLYYKELYETPNIRTIGWLEVSSQKFLEITKNSIALIFASCTEGGSVSAVHCMHAGLIPILSIESGVETKDFGFVLKESSINEIKECVHSVARLPISECVERSRKAWQFVRKNHTREKFAIAYRKALEEIIATYCH